MRYRVTAVRLAVAVGSRQGINQADDRALVPFGNDAMR